MGIYAILAEGFRYPIPGRLTQLRTLAGEITDGEVRTAYEDFLTQISQLSLGEWEELHTRTLDLNPQAIPYLGYQRWGESYQRGNFMASMNRLLVENQIDIDGELPDHLVPVLRYLDIAHTPPSELVTVLNSALNKLRKALKKTDPGNPYNQLLTAAQHAAEFLPVPESVNSN